MATTECPSCGAHLELVLAADSKRARWAAAVDESLLNEAQRSELARLEAVESEGGEP